MNTTPCETSDVTEMGFNLSILSQKVNNLEETASYAVALANAVESAVDNIVGSAPSDCGGDKDANEMSTAIVDRMGSANYVIMFQLKRINEQLERL